jgi:hypothetical protein
MKNRMILAAIMIVMPVLAFPQVRVTNGGENKVEIASTEGTRATTIVPGGTVFLSWLPGSGEAKYQLSRYNGDIKVSLGQFSGVASEGRLIVNSGTAQKQAISSVNSSVASPVNKKSVSSVTVSVKSGSSDVPTAVLSVTDSTSFRINIPSGPFAGVSLKAGQTSGKTHEVNLGDCTFPLFYDSEPDSTSSGLFYKWAVVSKIIVEGQTSLIIRDKDLKEAFNEAIIKKSLKSNLPFNFLITDEMNSGVVVAANSTSAKLSLHPGWNFMTIQYKDENGWPTQAVLILLVSESDRLSAGKKTGGEILSIERENIIFTTR